MSKISAIRRRLQNLLNNLQNLLNHIRVFSTLSDVLLYRKVRYTQKRSSPLSLRVKQAGVNPLLLRPGTTDAQVLWDTFYGKYHLPPLKLRPDCVIVDLGANVGYTVAHFAFLYPKSRIIAVELDKDNYNLASRNIRHFRTRCELIHAAVWSTEKKVMYRGDEGDGEWGFHVLEQNPDKRFNLKPQNFKTVSAKTIDSIFEKYHLETVDYLKMDIEGAEMVVLQGVMKWAKCIRSMKVEIHPQFNPAFTIDICREILESNGFKCKVHEIHYRCLIAIRY